MTGGTQQPLGSALSAALVAVAAVMPFAGQDLALAAWLGLALVANLRARVRLEDLVVPVPLLVLLVWIAVSATWSVAPGGTLQGAAQAAVLVLGGTLVAARRSLPELVGVVALAMKGLVLASWAVGLLLPGTGRTQEAYQAGSLEGPFAHRNLLAYVMVLALVTFVVQALAAPRGRRAGPWTWAAAAMLTVLATRSSTALLVAAAVGAVGVALVALLVLRPGIRRVLAVPGLGLALGLLWWATANLDTVAESVGRDPTLTGRTDIWAVVVSTIADRPLQGYGWGALWQAGTPVTERMWAEGGFQFFHAHDGYLDTALQIGLVGLALHLAVVATTVVRAARGYLAAPGPVRAWPLLVVTVVLAYNVSETVLPVHVGWLLVTVLACWAVRPTALRTGTTTTYPRAQRDELKV